MISNHAAIQAASAWLGTLDTERTLTRDMLSRLMEDCVEHAERMTSPAIIDGLFGSSCPLSILVIPRLTSARRRAALPNKIQSGTPSWQLDRVGGLLNRAMRERHSDVIEVETDAVTVVIYPSHHESSVLQKITMDERGQYN